MTYETLPPPITDQQAEQRRYGGDLNLGFSPTDIEYVIQHFTLDGLNSSVRRLNSNLPALDEYLIDTDDVLNNEQTQALNHICYEAQLATHVPGLLLAYGYQAYLRFAHDADKIVTNLPYDFKQIINMSVFSSMPELNLAALEAQANSEQPLLSTLLAEKMHVFMDMVCEPIGDDGILYDDETWPRMLLAGVGLAHQHCEAWLKDYQHADA